MEQRFLEKLNAETQRLVREIEEFASVEIEVRPTPAPSSGAAAHAKAVALLASEDGATLLYRDEQEFGTQSVLHELLHLHRYWVDFVPQLLPLEDPDGDKTMIAHQVENTLEHLVIVPKEAEYGLEPYAQLNETTRKIWQDYPWPDISEPWARRKNAFLSWLTTRFLVNDAGVMAMAQQALTQEALLEEAKSFTDKIARVVGSKEHCISTAIRFLHIPRQEATLAYLDIRNKAFIKKPIPEH